MDFDLNPSEQWWSLSSTGSLQPSFHENLISWNGCENSDTLHSRYSPSGTGPLDHYSQLRDGGPNFGLDVEGWTDSGLVEDESERGPGNKGLVDGVKSSESLGLDSFDAGGSWNLLSNSTDSNPRISQPTVSEWPDDLATNTCVNAHTVYNPANIAAASANLESTPSSTTSCTSTSTIPLDLSSPSTNLPTPPSRLSDRTLDPLRISAKPASKKGSINKARAYHFVSNSDKRAAITLRNTITSRRYRDSKVGRIAELESELEKARMERELWRERALRMGWRD